MAEGKPQLRSIEEEEFFLWIKGGHSDPRTGRNKELIELYFLGLLAVDIHGHLVELSPETNLPIKARCGKTEKLKTKFRAAQPGDKIVPGRRDLIDTREDIYARVNVLRRRGNPRQPDGDPGAQQAAVRDNNAPGPAARGREQNVVGVPHPPRVGINQDQAVLPRQPELVNERELGQNELRNNDQQPAIPNPNILVNGPNNEAPALRGLVQNDNNDGDQLPDGDNNARDAEVIEGGNPGEVEPEEEHEPPGEDALPPAGEGGNNGDEPPADPRLLLNPMEAEENREAMEDFVRDCAQRDRFALAASMITRCDGGSVEGVRQWLREVDQAITVFENVDGVDDNAIRTAKIMIGERSASGELRTEISNARTHLNTRPDNIENVPRILLAAQSWADIMEIVKPLFLTSNEKEYAKTRLETVRQRPNENLKSFNLRFKTMATEAYPAEDRNAGVQLELVKCYTRGLAKDRIARKLINHNPITLANALTFINNLLTTEEQYDRLGRGEASASRAEVSAITEQQSDVVSKLDQLTLHMKTLANSVADGKGATKQLASIVRDSAMSEMAPLNITPPGRGKPRGREGEGPPGGSRGGGRGSGRGGGRRNGNRRRKRDRERDREYGESGPTNVGGNNDHNYARSQPRGQYGPPRSAPRPNVRFSDVRRDECYKCGQQGHYAARCPNRPAPWNQGIYGLSLNSPAGGYGPDAPGQW